MHGLLMIGLLICLKSRQKLKYIYIYIYINNLKKKQKLFYKNWNIKKEFNIKAMKFDKIKIYK